MTPEQAIEDVRRIISAAFIVCKSASPTNERYLRQQVKIVLTRMLGRKPTDDEIEGAAK